jgi:hypothetical protein
MTAILDFDRDNNVCSSRKETSYGFPYAVTVVFDFRSTTYRMSYSELTSQEFIKMIHCPVVKYVLSLFLIKKHYRSGIIR